MRPCIDNATPCLITVTPSSLRPLETAQHFALRIVTGSHFWTKCLCLRTETNTCTIVARVVQLGAGHLVTLLRRQEAAPHLERVRQALSQNPVLFRGRIWASLAAQLISASGMEQSHLFTRDLQFPTYSAPPPWEPKCFQLSLQPLTCKKSLFPAAQLQKEALERVRAVAPPLAATFYTDGSINQYTGTVGAAFVKRHRNSHIPPS